MLLYRLLSFAALAAYAPYALLRSLLGKRRLGSVRGRLGLENYPDLAGGVWIHAVSVGEVGVARNLLSELGRRAPRVAFGLSVTTAAGFEMARKSVGEVPVFAFPLDLAGPVEKALEGVRPGLVLLTETEIWPLFLERAARRNIPVALVNGRLSQKSFRRYDLVRRAFSRVLARISLFAMQSVEDARRVSALGAPEGSVFTTGNLKYDLPPAPPFADALRLRAAAAGRPVIAAASTADGEEKLVLDAWESLPESSRPLLVVAPRRPERFDPVAALLERRGMTTIRRSTATVGGGPPPGGANAYLLDSIGELASLYAEVSLAFLGGSLVPVGGHNPIEAWAAGVPVVVGPHTENFRDVFADGERLGIASRVEDAPALARAIRSALEDGEELGRRSDAARRAVEESRGAVSRTADLVLPLLSSLPHASRLTPHGSTRSA